MTNRPTGRPERRLLAAESHARLLLQQLLRGLLRQRKLHGPVFHIEHELGHFALFKIINDL